METIFSRQEMLIGKEGMDLLSQAKVAVFGVGGVGSYGAEALARAAIGCIDLIDGDEISPTNINRQLIALHSTLGQKKVTVMKERILDINPEATVTARPLYYEKGNVDIRGYDYVIDAIDTVTSKIDLIMACKDNNVPVISAMGCGNKLNPQLLQIKDLRKTAVCPLCKVMRHELKKRGAGQVTVVYSEETPLKKHFNAEDAQKQGRQIARIPGSISFVPSAAGLLLAGFIVNELLLGKDRRKG